ncbi:hypothetical protein CKO35_11000 [Ectothiorhodospira shaposhnikovii]|uniref:hypothetical protein n=1 Tax=Ectothiorhodospira shaposhnikovii TaxID=1054 RepID=UPI001905C62B|nr:hypothetical protein [Ectothiorhodospira shaposhnikovii]MBK1673823.1 hypothetical protein [Ectothiorhodospira shaposhnikovii]
MHPALKILGVILFILCVAQAGWIVLGVGGGLAVAALAATGPAGVSQFWNMSRRLKWFFLSIILVFGWFTPGAPLLDWAGSWSPAREGLMMGLQRTLVLVLAVAAVVWLLQATSRESLVRGLLWLTRPLAPLGLPRERFAVRLVLTLEALPQVRILAAAGRPGFLPEGRMARLRGLGHRATGLFREVLEQAEKAPLEPIRLDPLPPPGLLQWLVLCLILLPLILAALH